MSPRDVFHNNLRILLSIDRHELEDVGICLTTADWDRFQAAPFRFFIRCDDPTADRIWAVIESRQPSRAAVHYAALAAEAKRTKE